MTYGHFQPCFLPQTHGTGGNSSALHSLSNKPAIAILEQPDAEEDISELMENWSAASGNTGKRA